MIKYFTKLFITGLVFLLPIVATILVVLWVVSFLNGYLGPGTTIGNWFDYIGLKFIDDTALSYIAGWIIVLLAIAALGLFIEITAKRWIIETVDSLIKKIPLIGMIYGPIRQLTNLIQKQDNAELQNMSPVYCRFGGTLFLALMPVCDEFQIQGRKYREVVIPTAPVPFGGAVIMVPSEDVFDAEMTVEQLLGYYVSMGVTAKDMIKVAKK